MDKKPWGGTVAAAEGVTGDASKESRMPKGEPPRSTRKEQYQIADEAPVEPRHEECTAVGEPEQFEELPVHSGRRAVIARPAPGAPGEQPKIEIRNGRHVGRCDEVVLNAVVLSGCTIGIGGLHVSSAVS
jgi:hypothetical protein